MNKNRQLKEAKVTEIREKLEKAQAVVLTKYQGLTVEEDTKLRKDLREAGIEYKVYKNTLVTLAAKELGLDGIIEFLEGPVSIAFSYEDVTAPARILNDFAKTHKALELKAGIIDGEFYDKDKIEQLATIPSKEVLIAKLLGSIKAPISSFARVLSAIADSKGNETAEQQEKQKNMKNFGGAINNDKRRYNSSNKRNERFRIK
eukprot:TRINITY_DN550_c0_g1_i8.p1 TRINITY_DN550_c0_g1~~TRINITY_DN550_c0_g1_i8.p1  ORF type:complete len:203 (+),score=40.39 TRINITY_DN550_c0_g1_i8:582-1190(+)